MMKKRWLTPLILCATFFACIPILQQAAPFSLLSVKSGSMAPALPTHSVIAISKNNQHFFQPGDVITYHADNRLITHRILHVGYDDHVYYQTKGDANHSPDNYRVRHQDVYGRVVYVTPPALSSFISFINAPKTIRVTLALFFTLLIPIIFNAHKKVRMLGKET